MSTIVRIGRAVTASTQRLAIRPNRECSWPRWARTGWVRARRPRPSSPSRAGSAVSDRAMARMTVTAAVTAIVETNPMPSVSSPSSAMTTVSPANRTAPPAVATARAVASTASSPSLARRELCLWMMKRA